MTRQAKIARKHKSQLNPMEDKLPLTIYYFEGLEVIAIHLKNHQLLCSLTCKEEIKPNEYTIF